MRRTSLTTLVPTLARPRVIVAPLTISLVLASTLRETNHMFGARGQVDPVRRLIGAASAWGGNPENDATYLNVTPAKNDGATVYKLNVKDVPVDGFW